jgi:hypothetical protein
MTNPVSMLCVAVIELEKRIQKHIGREMEVGVFKQ